MPSERVVAPLFVLLLHGLLLANVAAHRRHLSTVSWRSCGEWTLAALALMAYLRVVCCDPGALGQVKRRGNGLWCLLPLLPFLSTKAREARGSEAELQPIGRVQLDAMDMEDPEDVEEEVISLEDLSSVPSPKLTQRKVEAPPENLKLRFCKVCQMQQPLRTKHCRDCGRCIRTHDHHCPWVGTCVGEGNRVSFFWFLALQWLELVVFSVESCLYLRDGPAKWLQLAPLLVVGLSVKLLLVMMVSCLLCFHSYLAMANLTTWENISWHNISYLRGLNPELGSPFSRSLASNLAVYCCPPEDKTDDGWIEWELGDQHDPLENVCCLNRCCLDDD